MKYFHYSKSFGYRTKQSVTIKIGISFTMTVIVYYSNKEGVFTKHIPNELIESHLHQIADAIEEVVKMEELHS